jgi:hypothetical protein
VEHRELRERPDWRSTHDNYFPVVARVHDEWWVLRLNSFPDHPLWTLLVDGGRRFDFDDAPREWSQLSRTSSLPELEPERVEEALAPVRPLRAYGSEVGRPCDNSFCCAE